MSNISFIILFIYLTNWQVIVSLFRGALFSKTKSLPHNNKWLFELLKEKTGVKFNFKKSISKTYSGFLPLYPPNTIVLSSKIWEEFNKNELEWVALHEAGHRIYHHGYKYMPISLAFMALGIFILHHHANLFVNFITMAFLLTPIYQQIIRFFETQADKYAVTNMNNPKGMITGNKKFAEASKSLIYNNDFLRTIFTFHLSFSQRIKLAEDEIKRRNKNPGN